MRVDALDPELFQDTVAVAPRTVTEVSRQVLDHPEPEIKPSFPRQRSPQVNGKVASVQLDPEAWQRAKDAAGGDLRRIKILSTTDFYILNRAPAA